MDNTVVHSGVIDHIEGSKVSVRIVSESACAECNAKGFCGAFNSKEKIIDVLDFSAHRYRVGQPVVVEMKKSMGSKAVLLGYILPFVILLLTLLILSNVIENEIISGLGSLLILIPYYSLLYIFRNRLQKTFYFSIRS